MRLVDIDILLRLLDRFEIDYPNKYFTVDSVRLLMELAHERFPSENPDPDFGIELEELL